MWRVKSVSLPIYLHTLAPPILHEMFSSFWWIIAGAFHHTLYTCTLVPHSFVFFQTFIFYYSTDRCHFNIWTWIHYYNALSASLFIVFPCDAYRQIQLIYVTLFLLSVNDVRRSYLWNGETSNKINLYNIQKRLLTIVVL